MVMAVDMVGLVWGEYGAFRGIFGASDFMSFQTPHRREQHQSLLNSLLGASGRVGGGKRGMRLCIIVIAGLVIVRSSFGLLVLLGCKKTILTPTTDTNKEGDNLMIKRLVRGNQRERVDLRNVSQGKNKPKNEMGNKPNGIIITMGYSVTRTDVRINTHPPSKNPSLSVSPATLGADIFWLKIRVLEKKGAGSRRAASAYPPSLERAHFRKPPQLEGAC